jgi:hypothetical protein
MHGLVHKAYHGFVRATFGAPVWSAVVAAVPDHGTENFVPQDPAVLQRLVAATAAALDRPADAVLEDFGTYLASHDNMGQLRRLLRFGGGSYLEFLLSLEDLADRSRLALPSLTLPPMQIDARGDGDYALTIAGGPPGLGHVMTGLLRAMADDYGALVLLDHAGDSAGNDTVAIQLLDPGFHDAKSFDLRPAGA